MVLDIITAPNYQILINGKEFNTDFLMAVDSVSVGHELNLPALFVIKLNSIDFRQSAWRGIDLKTIKPGADIKILMGNGAQKAVEILEGEITALEATFGEDSFVEIRGYDRMHRLQHGTGNRSFKDMKDSDIVSKLAGEVGLVAQVDDTGFVHPYLFQNNQSNYHFLLERAKRLGYEMLVRGKTLFFRKSQAGHKPQSRLKYGLDLSNFSIQLKALVQGNEVEVRGWDVKTKKEIVARKGIGSEENNMKEKEVGSRYTQAAFGNFTMTVTDEAVSNSAEAEQLAKAKYNAVLHDFLVIDGQCSGNPGLMAGNTIEVQGVGERFSGIYYLTATKHLMNDDGYLTSFKGIRTGI